METTSLSFSRPHASYLRKEARCRAAAKKLLRIAALRCSSNKRAAALLKSLEFSTICAEKIRECLRSRRHSLSVLQLRSILFRFQRACCRAANLRSLAVTRHFCSAKVLVRGLRCIILSHLPPDESEGPRPGSRPTPLSYPKQLNHPSSLGGRRSRARRFSA